MVRGPIPTSQEAFRDIYRKISKELTDRYVPTENERKQQQKMSLQR